LNQGAGGWEIKEDRYLIRRGEIKEDIYLIRRGAIKEDR